MPTKPVRKNPMQMNGIEIDLRTKIGRRLKSARDLYAARLGGWESLSDDQRADVWDAAKARLFLEIEEVKYFEGSENHYAVIRAQNRLNTILKRLRIRDTGETTSPLGQALLEDADA